MQATERDPQKAEEFKKVGNKAFTDHKFLKALDAYTSAIESDSTQAVYFSNRAFCHLKLENYGSALEDSSRAIELDKNYSKVRIPSSVACPRALTRACRTGLLSAGVCVHVAVEVSRCGEGLQERTSIRCCIVLSFAVAYQAVRLSPKDKDTAVKLKECSALVFQQGFAKAIQTCASCSCCASHAFRA